MTTPLVGGAPYVVTDVHYAAQGGARAAMVAAGDRGFSRAVRTRTVTVAVDSSYVPGAFYLRELPALRAVLPPPDDLALIVIHGHVDLDPAGRPGLGAHVHAESGVPVIGVAKTLFRTADHAARVLRGGSTRPLYVTAAGMSLSEAADVVAHIAGSFRLPDAVKLADRLARGLESPDEALSGPAAGESRPEQLPRPVWRSAVPLDRTGLHHQGAGEGGSGALAHKRCRSA